MSDDETGVSEMRGALTAIAYEMQRFYKEYVTERYSEKSDSDEILNHIIKCKTTSNLKQNHIKKLRKNLQTACAVARTISSAKATETTSLTNYLDSTRKKYLGSIRKQGEKNVTINKLSIENQALRDQLEIFNNVIRLSYQKLQKIQNAPVENISTLEQLKHILVCCGQYYADHYNEREKCTRLEQNNRFLTTKMKIMESNLKGATDELRYLRTLMKRYKESKDNSITSSRQCIGVVCSEFKIGSQQRKYTNLMISKVELNNRSLPASITDLDLTNHLKTVKKLLNDQDTLIQDLKNLSKVINVEINADET